MAIAGLTDQIPENNLGRLGLKVWKGTRKKPGKYDPKELTYGDDLNNLFRLEPCNEYASRVLRKYFSSEDQNGDFKAEKINIYLPYDEVERTFETSMRAYNASRSLIRVCDRHSIEKELVTTSIQKKTGESHFTSLKEPNPAKECPMKGQPLGMECSLGCAKEGKLFFYVAELFNDNMVSPSRLVVHGFEDINYINNSLKRIVETLAERQVEGITNTPFPAHQWRHKIPYVLSRQEVSITRPQMESKVIPGTKKKEYNRTGQKAKGTTWAVNIEINPEFFNWLSAWQIAQYIKNSGSQLSPSTVNKLLAGDFSDIIDAESRVVLGLNSVGEGLSQNLLSSSKLEAEQTMRYVDEINYQIRPHVNLRSALASTEPYSKDENFENLVEVIDMATIKQILGAIAEEFRIDGDLVTTDNKVTNKAKGRLFNWLKSEGIDLEGSLPSYFQLINGGIFMIEHWLKSNNVNIEKNDISREIEKIMTVNNLSEKDVIKIMTIYKETIMEF